ncbi:hypothetical protein ACOI1H_21020 [Loktanella sp. DJP18]|uniref:DNA polymerase III subunit beta family protein n=1 Tax=Loktanella sp. DJP18 TaxID=3409788 RepID=UPI003BB73154
MKLTIQSTDLEAVLTAACAVSKSPDAIQIIAERIGEALSEVGPDTEERPAEMGQIRVIAFNENIVSEWRRPAEIKMAGSVAIIPGGLDRLVKASKNSDASFSLETVQTDNEMSLRLSTSRSAHEFPAESEAVFDRIVPGHTNGKRADLGAFARAIEVARVAAAHRGDAAGAKISMTGIHIHRRAGMIDIVATDGKRLAITTLREDTIGAVSLGEAADKGVTIPAEAINMMTSMLGSGPAHVEVVENNIIVEGPDGSVSIRMIDAPYPPYSTLLGLKTTQRIILSKSMLDVALQRSSVSLAKDKRTVAVKMSRGEDGVFITSAVAGQSSSECVSDEPGDEVAVGFDASYMMAAISVFPKSNIAIDFTDVSTPILVTSSSMPEITMLVMPCKIN